MEYNNEIIIEFNEENMTQYNKEYKEAHPRTKKDRITDPLCPLLNKFISMVRIMQHEQKVRYGEYCEWLLEKQKIPKLNLDNCEIEYKATFPTKTRRDLDGLSINSKTYNDILVEYGLLDDDSYFQLRRLIFSAEYQKGIRKIQIIVRY